LKLKWSDKRDREWRVKKLGEEKRAVLVKGVAILEICSLADMIPIIEDELHMQ